MATTTREQSQIEELEEQALERLADEGLKGFEPPSPAEEAELPAHTNRLAVVVSFSVLAAAVMAGGIFIGVSPRIWAAIAGILGVLLGTYTARIRKPWMMYAAIIFGIFGLGLLLVIPNGFGDIFDLRSLLKEASREGDVRQPPVIFTSGWRAIVGWLMGGLGFAAAWVAVEVKRPALGIMVPLPVVMITAISVPKSDQVVTGIVSLILFVISLGILSGTQVGDEEGTPSIAFEIRRGIKAVPMLAVITGALYAMAQTNLLFPPPVYDPSQEAQRPRTVPLSEVVDRPLFHVKSSITGPWKMGNLDVYDSSDSTWRLPPFAQSRLAEVPRSGVVDTELHPGIKAEFIIAELGGAVLPGLPNTVGIVAEGPKLAYDGRTGNIRLAQGTIEPSLRYFVVAAQLPKIEDLQQVTQNPADLECTVGVKCSEYMEIPEAPAAVKKLLQEAPNTSRWDRMDYLRQYFLRTVVSAGSGNPVPVTPAKVQDMLEGGKQGTPFEIVAAQAMLARWAGLPARIGYGYDGGEKTGDLLEIRPRNGASFLEVYIPGYKWLPVIGTPLQARTSQTTTEQQFNPNVAASDEVAVKLYVPIVLDPRSLLYAQIRRVIEILVPIILFVLGIYYTYPALQKLVRRSKRRNWAQHEGPEARIAVVYAEWRDLATDFGYRYDSDTPLMFLDRVIEDDEHTELAWLVTRTLWGDLQHQIRNEDADAAEELSSSLRKRLSQGHPWTMRTIAMLSRLSLRFPYAPNLRAEPTKVESDVEAA